MWQIVPIFVYSYDVRVISPHGHPKTFKWGIDVIHPSCHKDSTSHSTLSTEHVVTTFIYHLKMGIRTQTTTTTEWQLWSRRILGSFLRWAFLSAIQGMFCHLWRGFHVCLNCCSQSSYSMSQIYAVCLSKSRWMLEYRKYWTLEPLPKVSIHPAQDCRISSFYS